MGCVPSCPAWPPPSCWSRSGRSSPAPALLEPSNMHVQNTPSYVTAPQTEETEGGRSKQRAQKLTSSPFSTRAREETSSIEGTAQRDRQYKTGGGGTEAASRQPRENVCTRGTPNSPCRDRNIGTWPSFPPPPPRVFESDTNVYNLCWYCSSFLRLLGSSLDRGVPLLFSLEQM